MITSPRSSPEQILRLRGKAAVFIDWANVYGWQPVTGDGDFAALYRFLIKKQKKVVVVYAHQHLGLEIVKIKSGLFKISYLKLRVKKCPPK